MGGLTLAGTAFYSGDKFNDSFNSNEISKDSPTAQYMGMISKNYFENPKKYTSFEKGKEQYETYQKSELEKMLKEDKKAREYLEKKRFLESYYLSQDSLNIVIKQAYEEMRKEGKKWPKEFDKRLFRLMLKQESRYNVHIVSSAECMGLGQIGFSTLETLRPKEWESFKDPKTGEIDTLAVKKYLFNPVENVKLSLEALDYFGRYCERNDPNWKQSDLDSKRRKTLSCYNSGNGTMKEVRFDYNSDKLPSETRKYHEKIMGEYYDQNVQVKL